MEEEFLNWEQNAVEVNEEGVSPTVEMEPVFAKPQRTESTMNVPKKKLRRKRNKKVKIDEEPEVAPVGEARNPFLDREIAEEYENGLTSEQVKQLLKDHGYNEVVSDKDSFAWTVFKMYVQPINILVLIAAILSVAIAPQPIENPNISTIPVTLQTPERGWLAFALLLLLLNLFVWSDYFAEKNAGDAVQVLQAKLKPVATAKRDGAWTEVPVRELVPGDLLMLVGGSMIPADVQLMQIAGTQIEVDESALTGESLPSKKCAGDESLSGGIVKVGEAEAVVLRTGADSFFGKTISLLNDGAATDGGHLHSLLMKLTYIVTGIAAVFSIAFMVVLLVREDYFNQFAEINLGAGTSIAMAFGLLAAAMPLAIPVVTGAILAVGAKELAEVDVIVSRISCLEELAGCSVLCSDKTGTLTLNLLQMEKKSWIPDERFAEKDLLIYAALASSWVKMDAIDTCIMGALKERTGMTAADLEKDWKVHHETPFNAVTKRTEAEVTQLSSGIRMVCSKGAPQVIQKICNGGQEYTDVTNANAKRGFRTLGVCYKILKGTHEDDEVPWTFVGYFSLFDPPRVDSKEVLAVAVKMGLHVKMITGDQRAIAEETMARLGMGRKVVHRDVLKAATNKLDFVDLIENTAGFSGVYPEDKFSIVEGFQSAHHKVAMTGDGVNDAPALRKANVGVAVDGATDAAKAAADIIMVSPGLSGIVTALTRARKIFHRLDAYLIFRIAVSVTVVGFFFLASFMHFIAPTYAIVLIALINDVIMIAMSYDYVTPSQMPVEWNVGRVIVISGLISIFCIGQSLLFVYLARSVEDGGADWWVAFGSTSITSYQVVAAVFLELNIAIQLSIFSARTEGPFFIRRVGLWVLFAIFLGVLTATLIASLWTIDASFALGDGALMDGLYDGKNVLLIYLYCIFWWLALEACKTIVYVLWERVQFQENAHYSQFFRITGWSKKKNDDVVVGSKEIEQMPRQSMDQMRARQSIEQSRVSGESARKSSQEAEAMVPVAAN